MITFIVGVVIGAVVGIFFYRNNEKKISKMADKVDDVYNNATKKK